MKRLTKIIRLRITDEEMRLLKSKGVSKYIREALREKMEKEFPELFVLPF